MKKIVLSSLMIVGLVGVVTMATRAAFSDTETSSDNTFAAGTLDLKLNDANGVSQTFNVSGLKPGDLKDGGGVWLKNDGTVNGHAWLEIKNVVNNENGCTDPENEASDTSCGGTQGELGAVVKAWFHDGTTPVSYKGTNTVLNSGMNTKVDLFDINAGAKVPLYVTAQWLPTSIDNRAQNDSATFDVVVHLDQK